MGKNRRDDFSDTAPAFPAAHRLLEKLPAAIFRVVFAAYLVA